MGGYFAGLLNRDVLETTLDHETLRGARQRAGLRCDLGDHRRLPGRGGGLGAGLLRPGKRRAVRVVLQRHRGDGRRRPGHCATVSPTTKTSTGCAAGRWCCRGRGACATLDAATNVAASLLDQFPQPVQHHLDGACRTANRGAFRAERPYEVEAVTPA